MIGRLRGTLLEKQPPQLLVDVQGVGYELEASMQTFADLPAPGEPVTLHTHLVIQDDAHRLFGFANEPERALFRSLIRVSGVGPKVALTILSGIRPDDFVRCVELEDTRTLMRLPGIGKKTAERLVIEMRDRLDGFKTPAGPLEPATGVAPSNAAGEAVSALVALGYKPAEAARMAQGVESEGLTSEEIIRAALQRALR